MKAEPHRLGYAALDRSTRADLAAKPDLAEENHVGRRGTVVQAGQQCRRNGEIGSGLVQPNAGRDLHEDVKVGKRGLGPALEHGQQHREAPGTCTGLREEPNTR